MTKLEESQLAINLNFLLEREGIRPAKLARDVSLPPATIQNLRCGDNVNPTLSTLITLAKYFSVSVSQLIGEVPVTESKDKLTAHLKHIPILSWEEVWLWPNINVEKIETIIVENYVETIDFALTYLEKSSENFPENCTLLISYNIKPKHGDFVIVYKSENSKSFLRQWIDEGDEVYLRSLVVGYPLALYTSDYSFVGIVRGLKKRFD